MEGVWGWGDIGKVRGNGGGASVDRLRRTKKKSPMTYHLLTGLGSSYKLIFFSNCFIYISERTVHEIICSVLFDVHVASFFFVQLEWSLSQHTTCWTTFRALTKPPMPAILSRHT